MAIACALQPQNYGVTSGVGSCYQANNRVMRRIMKARDPRPCPHLWLANDSCLNCGKISQNHQLRAMPYNKFLKNVTPHVNKTSASVSNVCNVETIIRNSLQNPKKICLVLDLDHTLLNSTPLHNLSTKEECLKSKASTTLAGDTFKRGLFRLDHMGIITKLRPFVRTFLEETSKMFEMCIYTLGDRPYALEMAKLLDPENKYFGSRIISREDCTVKDRKGLDVLKKAEDSVVILDDTKTVWENHKDNLIVMDRYMYFSSGCRQFGRKGSSLSELQRDEAEFDGALSSVLQVLRRIHRDYSDSQRGLYHNNVTDVRQILKDVRKTVLRGCKIVFSGVISRNVNASDHQLWKKAESLGATCCVEADFDVTHVVSVDGGTEKSRWAIQQGKSLVNPRWIEAAYYLWKRQVEDKFPVLKT